LAFVRVTSKPLFEVGENVKYDSPFKLVPLPPVITLSTALLLIVTCVGIVVQETALPEPPLVNT
tara:strand:+ start:904 stop:1095 length:192 start_codon:yes stop_codon:yes gene_type:complete